MMLSKATVIGTGAMGTICAQVLAGNGANVALLGRRAEFVDELRVRRENRPYLPGIKLHERVMPTIDAASALRSSEFIVSAIPCQYMRAIWQPIAAFAPPDATICSVTKGIETGSLVLPSQILHALMPTNPVAVLSGPSIAPEVARCLPATVVVAAAKP